MGTNQLRNHDNPYIANYKINNKPCVELIEGKPFGILSLLDEECLFPEGTDASYLTKMQKNFSTHTHYQKLTGPVANNKFALQHYAGAVKSAGKLKLIGLGAVRDYWIFGEE
jgi:myosin heavy subunit